MSRAVSIVIPCRNGAAFLAATLRSALNQTEAPAEIVVVDDGSTDESRAVAEAFGPPVVVLAGPARGAAVARALGASRAVGDRIMFLDADDLLTPRTLAALGAALDGAPASAVALCPWDRLERGGDPGDPLAPWLVRPPSNALPRPGQDPLAAWLTGSWSPPCSVLWTRAGFEASGGWSQEAGLDDDGNLLRRALARGVAHRAAPGGLALYRRLPGEMVSYSGRRRERWGLGVRLASLADTVAALEAAGQAGRYRPALVEALAELRADAADAPDLVARIDGLRARVGGARAWDGPLAAAGRLGARGRAWLSERGHPVRIERRQGVPVAPARPAVHPLVSVVIPTFDRAAQAEAAVRSALAQTYEAVEVIVVDDGSTDDTRARLAAIADPRLRVIGRANGGVARARNTGIAAATGAYVALLDSDDLWHPDKLMRQVAALEAAPRRVGFCYTGVTIHQVGRAAELRRPAVCGDALAALLLTNPVHAPTSSGLARREVFDAVGGFDPDLPAVEDWDWLQRLARLYDLTAVDAPLTVYRDHDAADRRSRAFRRNMIAREMLWKRNRHAMRRVGVGALYLLESARRELREPDGDPRLGRALVGRALAERPQAARNWAWLPFMVMPRGARDWLRARDADAHERRRRAAAAEIRPD